MRTCSQINYALQVSNRYKENQGLPSYLPPLCPNIILDSLKRYRDPTSK